MKRIIFLMFALPLLFLQAGEKKVLVEVFTNSHCGVCPGAYNALASYRNNNPANAAKLNYIYYHMSYPYPDDPLNQANTVDPQARNQYYGPFTSTPRAFFRGATQTNGYSGWPALLNTAVAEQSPLEISLHGTVSGNTGTLQATITRSGNISQTDLVVHVVLVENLLYAGRNGISNHTNVLRKMVTGGSGESFSIAQGETKTVEKALTLNTSWVADSVGVIVFVQSTSTKEIYQSEYKRYSQLTPATDIRDDMRVSGFTVSQNYPNPFNPSTAFTITLEQSSEVAVKFYNALGKEVLPAVIRNYPAGTHAFKIDASSLNSGIYFYEITSGKNRVVKKMSVLK